MTLPLILALSSAPAKEKQEVIRLIRKHNEETEAIQKVVSFIHAYQGTRKAQSVMESYRSDALKLLLKIPENPARDALEKLCYYITERSK